MRAMLLSIKMRSYQIPKSFRINLDDNDANAKNFEEEKNSKSLLPNTHHLENVLCIRFRSDTILTTLYK